MAGRGKGWEMQLEVQHDAYRRDGKAFIYRCNPDFKYTGTKGWFPSGTGPPDFGGVINGRAVCFDAKEVAGDRWNFGLLKMHQALDLAAMGARGGVSFLVIRYKQAGGVQVLVPWDLLEELWWDKTTKSITWHEPLGRPFVGADWLEAYRELYL